MIAELFINIFASILYERGKQGLGKYFSESPAEKAINRTADYFPSLTYVRDALYKWCRSGELAAQVDALQEGLDDRSAEEEIVESFQKIGGFYDNISILKTPQTARQVLEVFLKYLEEEVSKTELWPIVKERRDRRRYRELGAQIRNEAEDIKAVIRETIGQSIPPFDLESSPQVREKVHFTAVDLAVELLKEGKAKSARARLEGLRATVAEESPSVDLLFRIAANLGSCALLLDELELARTEYETALALKPDHHLVLSYAALVAMIRGDAERALNYARRSRPEGERDPQITSNYLRVLNSAGLTEEIQSLIDEEDWIEQDPNCSFALGIIQVERNDFARAEAYFKFTLQAGGDNAHAHRLLAQAIILQIDEVILNNPPLRLSEEMLARIEEAEEHLTSAVRIFENHENPARLYEALLQRSYVRGLRGNTAGSLADIDRILDADPNHPQALRQKGHTLLAAGNTEEALRYFNKIEDDEERGEATLAAALAYHKQKQYAQVIDLLAEHWRPEDWTRQQAILADLLVSAYHHTGNKDRVTVLTAELERAHREDPEALVLIARQQLRTGRKEEALSYYTRALERALPGNQYDRISHELADYYFEAEQWAEAADHYKNTVETSFDNPEARKYLLSLYNSGARRAAFELAQAIRNEGPAIPFVSEVEAQVLAAQDRHEDALALFEQLSRLEPNKVSHRLWSVQMLIRLNRVNEARNTLSGIGLDEIKQNSTALIRVAMLRQKLDLGGDLPFSYRARQVDFNSADIHHAYVQLFMNHTKRERGDLDVNGVAVDSAVHLLDSQGAKHTYVIVEQEEYDLQRGEIPPSDERAVKLIGRHVGDRVRFNEGRADEVEYEIAEIQSKYVYAFQQTIIRHTEWFGGSEGMMVMNVADGDLSKLTRVLDRQQERREDMSDMYGTGRLPLASLARATGKTLFETWASIVSSTDMRLYATSGELGEIERATRALGQAEEIVLEVSALLTLGYLDLLDKVPQAFARLIVATQVLDTLNEWLGEIEAQSPYMTMWKERDQYYRTDVTEEMIARRRQFIAKIKSFVEQHAVVLPAVKALDVPGAQLEEYYDVLGKSASSSLFVASDMKLPLFLDDMGLTQIATDQRWQVQGVPTQLVLMRMKSRGLISLAEYYAALKKLILANYAYILINAHALWWMCRNDGMKASTDMQRILQITLGPECVPEAALRVGAEFIHRVWLEVADKQEKLHLVDYVIDAVISGREATEIKGRLKEMLTPFFRYLPSALPELFERIDSHISTQSEVNENGEKETEIDGIGKGTSAG